MPSTPRRVRLPRVVTEPVEAVKLAGLTYVIEGRPGITPRRAGKSFTYVHPEGTRVRDAATLVRIGNEENSRENGSFGLTTLRNRHVAVSGSLLRLHFRGKSGKEHAVDIRDP